MHILGIDPGQSGAFAFLDSHGKELWVEDMPLIDKQYNLAQIVRNLETCKTYDPTTLIVIEKQWTRPGDARPAAGRLMEGYGALKGIAAALHMPCVDVPPATWKRRMGLIGQGKHASRLKAQGLFPHVDLHLVKHHGRAEALLLAWWMAHNPLHGIAEPRGALAGAAGC